MLDTLSQLRSQEVGWLRAVDPAAERRALVSVACFDLHTVYLWCALRWLHGRIKKLPEVKSYLACARMALRLKDAVRRLIRSSGGDSSDESDEDTDAAVDSDEDTASDTETDTCSDSDRHESDDHDGTDSDATDDSLVECDICLEDVEPDQLLTLVKCSHIFCKSCLRDWASKGDTCPTCRAPLAAGARDTEQRHVPLI
ncbi:MAG: hypothetical protein MHM6MM_005135 [Cercozoa sp. M6MM]